MRATLVWFRQDLRVEDNAALVAAARRGAPVIPVYIWSPGEQGDWAPGAAARWWLHHSLGQLDASLRRLGSRLIIGRGRALKVLRGLVRRTGADTIAWNRRYQPAAATRDAETRAGLERDGLAVKVFESALLFDPADIRTRQGGPLRVFTPFWRACLAQPAPAEPTSAPGRLASPSTWPESLAVDELGLLPSHDWTEGLAAAWTPGELDARAELNRFLDEGLASYELDRDRPSLMGTSRLSPYLCWGELGPRQVWHAVREWAIDADDERIAHNAEVFLRELGWREFSYHLLHHFPSTVQEPLRPEFACFPWRQDARALRAWQHGRTGYPLVDAGMRELWATGWMHNRVRMVVASFLVKHLLLPWQQGACWFWDTLVDADLANNTMGWQWSAGCGADAAPYFRIFNPVTQSERYDPDGVYLRRWLPELDALPGKAIHRPWETGIRTYPKPVVDHAEARGRALAAFRTMNRSSPGGA
ncbi:MAG TPA: deoxyribodipyrimidine photo-lyase [Phycisphaerae bacterium]|nr:deoxyribodipyrimidine photo-lyase [Phycisphaerae bacterium]HRY67678.1 deoxyribodipyrimidine photo-lyase [Phycisphaerae bacterium]HSA25065.1 deoxyribodipyrimidine photo-lyase [Phycisphaerae bacterium]